MKDSGLQWVGKIPAEWEVAPLAWILKIKPPEYAPSEELLSVYLDKGVIRYSDVKVKRTNLTSQDLSKYQLVLPGEFVLNNQQAWRGSVGVSSLRGIVSPAYIVMLLSESLDASFANYLLRSSYMVDCYAISSRGVGTIQRNLYWKLLRTCRIAVPPLAEQRSIAAFLDSVTGKIDALRGKLKREIDRFEDYKKSAITKAVCHGLDPKAKMKDSGIPWVGKVPEGWKEQRISKLYLVRSEKVSDKEHQPLTVGKMGVVPQLEHVAKTNDGDNRKHVCPGDFVINSRSDRRGACGISSLDGSVSLINIVLRPREEMDNSYFNWVFHTEEFADEFYKWGKGIDADVWTTRWMMMKKIIVPFPPLPEQREIAAHIDAMVGRVNAIVEKRKRQLDALDKLKRTVVYDYVTGKREVPLPKGGRSR